MADVVKEIEITAALSADYQDAFKAASSIAASSAKELGQLTKRQADLEKMLDLSSRAAEASANGNAKSAQKLADNYDKLAAKLGLVDKSAAGVNAELARVGARQKEVSALNVSASKSAAFGKLARDIKLYSRAAKQTKDQAIIKQLDAMKGRFRELGGVIPTKGLGKFGGVVSRFPGKMLGVAGGIAAVGAAAVAATKKIWGLGMSTIRTGDQIAKTSRQLGIDAQVYQEFAWAVGLGGASEQELASGLQHLNQQMEAAANGNSKATKAFSRLGISMSEIKSMNTEEMFVRISDALSNVDDVAAKTKTTMDIFGSAGTKLATAIKGGSAALEDMRKEARDSGFVLDDEALANAERATDNFARAQMSLKGALNVVGVEAMPTINDLLTDFAQAIKDNRDFIREFAGALATGFRFAGKVVKGLFTGISVGVQVIKGAHEFWVGAFADLFQAIDNGTARVKGFLIDIKDTVVATYDAAVQGVATAIGFAVDRFTAFRAWGSGLVTEAMSWVTAIPDRLATALDGALESIETWWADLKDSAKSWVVGIINDLTESIMNKLSWLSDALSQIPVIGSLISGDSAQAKAIAGGGNVTIQVNNAVDARGAAPGAGAEIRRAVQASGGETGANVAAALAQYQGLSYAGGAI